MKKIYSFALIISAVLAFLTSCDNESFMPEDESRAEGLTSFVAYLDNDVASRATISGLKVSWADGDEINVNGSIFVATADKADPTQALFTLKSGETAPTAIKGELNAYYYYAFYPASAFISKTYISRFKLQDTQTYNGSDVSTIDYMYVKTADPNDPTKNITFKFKHVNGILALDIVGEEKVTSIQVTAPTDFYLCGTIGNISYKTAGISYSSFTTQDRGSTVTLNCGAGVQLNKTTPERFYISLPEKVNGYPSLEIKINTASGKSMTINSTKTCTVTKGTLFTLPKIEFKATPLSKHGIYQD